MFTSRYTAHRCYALDSGDQRTRHARHVSLRKYNIWNASMFF